MTGYLEQVLLQPRENAPQWLELFHRQGRQYCQHKVLPTRKVENWRYTNLRALEQNAYWAQPANADATGIKREHYSIEGLDCHQIVFVNGYYNAELSGNTLPDGVTLVRFAEADANQVEAIQRWLGTVARGDQSIFTALNESGLEDGVYLNVEKGVQVETPIQVCWLTTGESKAATVIQRLLAVMEAGSKATLLECFNSDEIAQNSFTNGITEMVLKDNAQLQHYRLHTEQEQALHIGGVHVSLGRDSRFNSFNLAMGGTIKRIDLTINHDAPGAESNLQGVYLLRNKQHVDYHTCVEHKVPHGTSTEVFRGIIGGAARAVFNGRIHIHPNAQKILAQLNNKNLLTSAEAEVDTKPELEINADDVQCAHGATVAQLDEGALHYLRTRGIDEDKAVVMLSFGFINELLDQIPDSAIADYLRPLLSQFFSADQSSLEQLKR